MSMKKYLKALISIAVPAGLLMSACSSKPPVEPIYLVIPSGLFVTYENQTMNLSWNPADNAEGYNIYRSESRYGEYIKINVDTVLDESYQDKTSSWYYYKVTALCKNQESGFSDENSYEMRVFGENTYIFSPYDNPEEVQKICTSIFKKQEKNQFGENRYALLFKPGVYDEKIQPKIGFYTHIAGLALSPKDTVLSSLTCEARWLGGNNNHNATCNFWRGAENLTVNSSMLWAVSQATFLRRVKINGGLTLHDNNGWASGGFLSDSLIEGKVDSGSQQQWLSRNVSWKNWTGQNWNMVFVGLEDGCAPNGSWPETRYTTVNETLIIREKPFLYYDNEKGYQLYVPELRSNSKGISWNKDYKGRIISYDEIYFASPVDTADTINAALKSGLNIIFTPGIYNIDKTIEVKNQDTVILGLGLASLVSTDGNIIMKVSDEDGIIICGLLFDAGTKHTETLFQVGDEDTKNTHENNPIILSDLFFRVGGVVNDQVSTNSCAIINSNNVIGDNFWVWRADHGSGVAWNKNYAKNGIIINGNDVVMYALMVEHFQEYQTIWNGERGKTYFYQSEIPYDVPNQESWMNKDINGFASYKVSDHVKNHEAYGLGIYSYHRDAVVDLNSVMEVPDSESVIITNICSVMITGNPGISHIINNHGQAANTAGARRDIMRYCNGIVIE